ncbi:N-acetyl-1-D-myo-inositol-2-amino-2-deoxy-alpha-D-glucopyranoside deacetylase [Actinocatenispora rupis]|uniref:1D-myo-inositol 2-acetamido-2-deoxy-alpha-D-glucopyranoside deacetylase n=1 Tax=Actinocatenispora rupis TaxID=519421 RepID=A0A8J3NA59_9ACTN|nr:N-acetyl-1-D-myo-inositol-2-amino-2-deoxy-alpha-D-glucopyranoside deacetylase [Actinocatenispora rupis]GID11766.1 1D-myo-inositol 2-acetamido-2-deoxy-alpha-D-glucopyranoside deacetylase [Actinocatenispora rupis]
MTDLPARRLLLVHAHPDDEVIGTGATMARYIAEGAHVTLVTCTLGEEGEIHVPELAQLAADQADQLGGYRISEWRAATSALGLTDGRFLGGAGRFRDSGMMGTPANENPRAFWQADLDAAAGLVADVIREIRPQVVVTYDPNGFYGHPDHIQAHRVAMRGVELAAPDWQVAKVYWTAVPKSVLAAGMKEFSETTDNPFAEVSSVDDLPFGSPDEEITARIDGSAYSAAKAAAIQAYPTQIPPTNWLNSMADAGGEALGVEYFRLAVGTRGPGEEWEDDLFAGIDEGRPAGTGATRATLRG